MDIWRIIQPSNNNRCVLEKQIVKKLKKIFKFNVSTFLPLSVRIIRQMNENQLLKFVIKITSFIHKWTWMYERSRSCSLTKVLDFFFTSNTNFHIVFFINNHFFIYNSRNDTIISAQLNRD